VQEGKRGDYAAAVVEKSDVRLKLATGAWLEVPRESWLAKGEEKARNTVAVVHRDYTLPKILEGAGCIDDTWTVTSGPPDSRRDNTAVWTGSEMIVWGGSGGVYFNTGGRYNPATDSWTATTNANAPTARALHTAVWTGT